LDPSTGIFTLTLSFYRAGKATRPKRKTSEL
jgi:hypothetical protein